MIEFNRQKLISDLHGLPPVLRVAFAAACAERSLQAYLLFMREQNIEDQGVLVDALADVWANPTKANEVELKQQLEDCMECLPEEDAVNGLSVKASHAQEAGVSVVYALRTRMGGKADDAAWSAQTTYEILDNYVINQEGFDTNQPGGEIAVLSHPLVQAELLRQQRDIDQFRNFADAFNSQLIMEIRDRAKAESQIFFGSNS